MLLKENYQINVNTIKGSYLEYDTAVPAVKIELSGAEGRMYASVHQQPLVQIMAFRLVGANPLSESVLEYC